jgi:hypothetical protein
MVTSNNAGAEARQRKPVHNIGVPPHVNPRAADKIRLFDSHRRSDDFTSPWAYHLPIKRISANLCLFQQPQAHAEEQPVFFESLRDMFRTWRLGLCECGNSSVDVLETIRLALHATHLKRHLIDREALIDDVFDGSTGYFEMFYRYLEEQYLLDCDLENFENIELTREGNAALLMLLETMPGSNTDTSAAAILQRQEEAENFIQPRVSL